MLEEIEQLNIVAKGTDICSFINFSIFTGTLNGPLLFEVLRLLISSAISFTVIEFRKKLLDCLIAGIKDKGDALVAGILLARLLPMLIKNALKEFAIEYVSVIALLSTTSLDGILFLRGLKEIISLIPFQMFLICDLLCLK